MYPVFRLVWQIFAQRNAPVQKLTDTYTSRHICWPWDLDIFFELNNGRTLTLYDLGRIPMGHKSGLWSTLKANKWGLTVAGSTVRYRRRIRAFDRIVMKSRLLGWDDRFVYIDQSMWTVQNECAGQVIIRSAVTGKSGIIPPDQVFRAMNIDHPSPPLPEWVMQWIAAENTRPWPPHIA